MLCGPLVKRWERPRHSAVCKARSYRSCCRSRLIPIRWLILIGGASIRRSAHNTYGAPTGGCCSVDLLAVLARIALEVAVFVASDETASATLPNTHTKAVSPAAPADRRRAIRRVDLLAVLARIALEVAVFVASDETASTTLPNAHTKAASPAAPADRRHAIRRVDLLALVARYRWLRTFSITDATR